MTRRLQLPEGIAGCLFDLDGVLTRTAALHAAAWKQTFDAFLRGRTAADGRPLRPFDLDGDYYAYVDGRPRADGVRAFLAARVSSCPRGRRTIHPRWTPSTAWPAAGATWCRL